MSDKSRQAILDAAVALLPTNSGASMAEIAVVADVARTTVHRLFTSREELLAAVAIGAIDRIDAAVLACQIDQGPAGEALLRIAEALVPIGHEFRFLEVGPQVWKLDALNDRWYRLADRLGALIERGKRDGDLRPDIPTAWLVDLFSSALWCAADSIDEGRVARNDAPRLLIEVLLRGAST